MKIGLCVPVYNQGSYCYPFVNGIINQSYKPDRILVIDTNSDDLSREMFQKIDAQIYIINKKDFDHGGTRQMAVDMMCDVDIIIFITQDAILSQRTSIENLIACFFYKAVGAAYGRQLPRFNAHPIEAHARLFNYPGQSAVRCWKDIPKLGIRTIFISNSFAAYRTTALRSVGGFSFPTIFGEDACVAAKMIRKGWQIAYSATAQVYHSHNYTYMEEFRRYFEIGVFHANEPWILDMCGHPSGEGKRFMRSELNFLLDSHKNMIPGAIYRSILKWCGYKLGLINRSLPKSIRVLLSGNRGYWSKVR